MSRPRKKPPLIAGVAWEELGAAFAAVAKKHQRALKAGEVYELNAVIPVSDWKTEGPGTRVVVVEDSVPETLMATVRNVETDRVFAVPVGNLRPPGGCCAGMESGG